jgi:alkylated DNA nucleotide flippase Atl1
MPGKVRTRKTWRDKLQDDRDLPKIVKSRGKMRKRWGAGTIVIPRPREVNDLMCKVRKGRVTTINEIRSAVARKHRATMGCPICCGIFARIAAGAAAEDAAEGKKRITPYWRTLKARGVINDKYPGGAEGQKRRLEAEGHTVVRKGKNLVVVDYDRKLARL